MGEAQGGSPAEGGHLKTGRLLLGSWQARPQNTRPFPGPLEVCTALSAHAMKMSVSEFGELASALGFLRTGAGAGG